MKSKSQFGRTPVKLPFLTMAVLLAWVFGSSPGAAQVSTKGEITGLISDETGATVPGASLTLTNRQTGVIRTTQSSPEGYYTFSLLELGTYTLKAERRGFQTAEVGEIEVRAISVARVNVTLKVGEVAQTITVTAESELINTQQANIAGNIEASRIVDLPGFSTAAPKGLRDSSLLWQAGWAYKLELVVG